MNLKINGNGNGGAKGGTGATVKVVLLVVAVALVGLLLYRVAVRLSGPRETVWVASRTLEAGSLVGPDDVAEARMKSSSIPDGAVRDRDLIEGVRLNRSRQAGEAIVAGDFEPGGQEPVQGLSTLVPEGRVLMALRFEAASAPYSQYRRGDRLEVVAVDRRGFSQVVASDAYLIGWMTEKQGASTSSKLFGIDLTPPTLVQKGSNASLLLGLHPQDVFPVAEAEAVGAKMSFILHGEGEVRDGEMLSLPQRRTDAVEVIAGASRQKVAVN